ncbi:MAG: LytTR family transcriptional regulator [Ruminococcus sp.]|nr:LytTR family transcriptional regulator [Ruminococcus sp.]
MKIKLTVSRERYAELEAQLEALGIEIDNSSDLVLSEENRYTDFIMGRKDGAFSPVPADDIIFIETFGNEVVMHTLENTYNISERLIRLEGLLNPHDFLRVSNSVIVAVKFIRKIRPTFSSKYILTLKDGSTVDVTRSYFTRFKDFFGL